jgi:hypothetical protein
MSDLPDEASAEAYVVWPMGHNKREPLPGPRIDPPAFEEESMTRDPRSEAEKARADLARNSELGMAVPESPPERAPSVTPQTFGDTTQAARDTAAGEGLEAGGVDPELDDGDSTGTGTIPVSGRVPVWPEEAAPGTNPTDEDVLSRAKE